MKAILNWRYYALYVLFGIGMMSALLIFGEDERPLSTWIETRIYLAAISAASFYSFKRLALYWRAKNEIHDFLNTNIY